MYRILIVGAGYTGGAIGRYFAAKKQKVFGLVRSVEKAGALQKDGILPIRADLLHPETLAKLPAANFIVLAAAPSERDESSYRRLYLDGIANVLKAVRKNPRPSLIVYLSSTGVWRERAGAWVEESAPPDPDTEKGRILARAEQQVLNSGFPACVFRLAGIYGPVRNRLESARVGRFPDPTAGDRYMNMMHIEDIVAAIPVLFKSAAEGEVYCGVDEEPVRMSAFYAWLSSRLGLKYHFKPDENKPLGGKRIRSDKLKSLDFTFKYPSFREGYEQLIT